MPWAYRICPSLSPRRGAGMMRRTAGEATGSSPPLASQGQWSLPMRYLFLSALMAVPAVCVVGPQGHAAQDAPDEPLLKDYPSLRTARGQAEYLRTLQPGEGQRK